MLIGFSTYQGTVMAASDWDEPPECKRVRPALAGSYESLFHDAGKKRFWLDLRDQGLEALSNPRRLERAIGVIYRPETERVSHYFYADLPAQFDAVLHFDESRTVEPLEHAASWETGEEAPESFPSGI